MSGDEAARFFDAIAGRYDRVYAVPAEESRRRMKRIVAALPRASARVLDLGVGTGRELAALLDAGHRLTGVDVSRPMLERCARRSRPVELVHLDFWATPLPFADGSFDAVIALHGTLAHPPDEGAVGRLCHDLARIVVAGGTLLAEVPRVAWLDAVSDDGDLDDRRVVRTGPRTCVYEDRVAGASIAARLLDETEWHRELGPLWRATFEPIDPYEWLIVARHA